MAGWNGQGLPNPWGGDETVKAEMVPGDDRIDNPMGPQGSGLTEALGNEKAYWMRAIRRRDVLSLLLGVIALACLADRLWFGNRTTVLAYGIEVAETGQVRGIRPLPQPLPAHLAENMAVHQIEHWIFMARLLHDRAAEQAQRFNWEQMYKMTETAMYERLKTHTAEQMERIRQGEAVDIPSPLKSILPISAKERSYAAEWYECTYGRTGYLLKGELWKATLVLSQRTPTKEMTPEEMDAWHRNASGIFVHEYSWRPTELSQRLSEDICSKDTKKGPHDGQKKTLP